MGGRGKSSGYAGGGSSSGQGTQQQAQQPSSGGKPQISATSMSDGEYMSRYNAQNPNQFQKSASYDYTDPRAQSNGYAKSQNMNYALDTGQPLTKKQQDMLDGMEQMARPLGKDTLLHRGAHQDVLEALGVKNYDTKSLSELRQSLVGAQWQSKALTSTSYNASKSPFLSGPLAGGREVIMRIHAAGSTKATMVNPPQAEVVLGRNTHFQITDVNFTGRRANPRANWKSGGWPQVVLDIEVW